MWYRWINRRWVFALVFVMALSPFGSDGDSLPDEIQRLADEYLSDPTIVQGCRSQPPEMTEPSPPPSQVSPSQTSPSYTEEHPHLESRCFVSPSLDSCEKKLYPPSKCPPKEAEGYTVNFENISVIQLIQFISKISGTNFIFDEKDLQFCITIVSEDQTSVEDLSAALIQVLKIHGLSVVEQGRNILIYKDQLMSKVSTVISDCNINEACNAAIITRVFRLYNVDPKNIQKIIKPLVSPDAIVEISSETRHLIVSDITANVDKVADLLSALDTPNAAFEVCEYSVRSAYPQALVAYAKEILAPLTADNPMQMIAQPSSKRIFIVSTPYLNKKALQVLSALDTEDITDVVDLPSHAMENNNFYMYKLRYQSGLEISHALHNIGDNLQYAGVANLEFVNAIYSAQWLEANNSIVIAGTDAAIKKVVQLLEELDSPPKQVYVEVLIIDTTLQNSLDFGVQWIALGDEQDKLAYASGLLSNSPPSPNLQGGDASNPGARFVAANPAANPPAIPNPGRDVPLPQPSQLQGFTALSNTTSAFGFGIIGNILRHNGQSFLTLGALVSALDEEAETKIVTNPCIMVEDTQPARFFVGQNIPYQTTSTVIQQTGSVTQNIQYQDIGVTLAVTPTIAPNNVVTLAITQNIEENISGQGNLTPTVSKTETTTRVHVPDGTFLVMSGHIRDKSTDIHSGIPCLGTLPLLGPVFARNIEQREKRNLIMFIRPRVVTNIQEGLDLTNEEGFEYNWQSNPCSIFECGPEIAPECEVYPSPASPGYQGH